VNVRRSIAAAALVLAVPALSSCGVSFGAQTDQVYNPSTGVDDQSGEVDVLNALIVSGTSGSGTVVATLVNKNQDRPDTLTDVTGAGADSGATVQVSGPTTIPAAGLLDLAKQGGVSIRGQRVSPGNFVTITFSFAHAKTILLEVPVVSSTNPDYAGVKVPS
jgi:hypothetical protein